MHNNTPHELFDIVNSNGEVTGTATRAECHGNPALLHQVVHVLVFNSKGELLLQKRAPDKDIQPDKWDTSVGGHVNSEEIIESAAVREIEEEIGIDIEFETLEFCYRYIMTNEIESELVYTFRLCHDGPFTAQESEISELKFWNMPAISHNLESGIFTPNFCDEITRFNKHFSVNNAQDN